jgi:hypothetical protein
MQAKRTNTLEDRAAAYFGAHDEPVTYIKTDRRSCFLVMRRQKTSIVFGYYSERSARIEAEYWWLTEAKRAALVDALSSPLPGEGK